MSTYEPRRPRSVIILTHTGQLGGAELALLRLCAAIEPEQFTIRVILFQDGPLRDELTSIGISTEVFPLDPGLGSTSRHTFGRSRTTFLRSAVRGTVFAVRLGRRLRQLAPDVVQSASMKAHLVGLVASTWARRPFVWYLHDRVSPDYLPPPVVALVRALSRLPSEVIVNSRSTGEALGRPSYAVAYPGYTPAQADSTRPHPDAHSEQPSTVLLLGRISPTKGQLEFVRAAARVLRDHPRTRFRIVGSPMFGAQSYAEEVQALAAELGMAAQLDWVDFVADPRAEIDGADLIVHASPVPEPFGQVVLEAAIRGRPLVATDAGGVREILQPPGAGEADALLVPPGDVPALASAITEVLSNPEAAMERAEKARLQTLARFPVAQTARAVTDVWRPLTHSPCGLRVGYLFVNNWEHEFRNFSAGDVPSHRLFGAAELGLLGHRVHRFRRRLPFRWGPTALLWRGAQAGWVMARQHQLDCVVATHEASALPVLILRRLHLVRVPVLVMTVAATAPEFSAGRPGRLKVWALRGADALTVFASDQVPALQAAVNVPAGQVHFIPFGVDTGYFSPPEHPRGDGLLAVGTNAGKDYVTLMKALPPQLTCTVVTDADNRRQAGTWAGGRDVRFLSDIPISQLRGMYAAAGLLVIPLHESTFSSGQTVLLENLAMNTPVVVSAVGSIRDYVDASLVTLVAPGNVQDMGEALRHPPPVRTTRPHVVEHFSSERFASRLDALLRQVVALTATR